MFSISTRARSTSPKTHETVCAAWRIAVKNQYVCDVGDFAKFGLLRALAGVCPVMTPPLRVGLVWYLTPDCGNTDGRHRAYLDVNRRENRRIYRACDPDLYDALQRIPATGRSTHSLESSELLPAEIMEYHGAFVAAGPARAKWADEAFQRVRRCSLLCLDPDNGLAPRGVTSRSKDAEKYVFLDELPGRITPSQSVVIYQHLGRSGDVAKQAERHLTAVRAAFPDHATPWAVRFRRGTARLFLIIPASKHAATLRIRCDALLAGPWGRHRHFDGIG